MTSADLSCIPGTDMIDELKRRNCSFVFGHVDHLQFNKDAGQANAIVWFLERGGNVPLQLTLGRLLAQHLEVVEQSMCSAPSADPADDS